MSVSVPSQYDSYVKNAAAATGIPEAVVAEQIYYESSFNPQAVSPAGAEGIAQFEPATFASYGPSGGSPFNVGDAFQAYVSYMKALLAQEGGDLRRALAAYNAGPGNLGAGYGYADHILSVANSGDVTVSGGGNAAGGSAPSGAGGGTTATNASWISDVGGWISDLGSWLGNVTGLSDVAGMLGTVFTPIGNVFTDLGSALGTFMHAVLWLVNPMNWVRLFAGVLGGVCVLIGSVLVFTSA